MDDLEVLRPVNLQIGTDEEGGINRHLFGHEEHDISDQGGKYEAQEKHRDGDSDSDSDSDGESVEEEEEEIFGYRPPTFCARIFLIIFNVVLPIMWLGAGCYYCYEIAQLYYVDDDGLDQDYNRNDMEICYFMITAFITFCTIATISFFLWYCGDGKKLTMPRKALELFASTSLVGWGTYIFFFAGDNTDEFLDSDLYMYCLASYYFIVFFAFYTIATIFDHFFPCCCRSEVCCDFDMGRKRLKEEREVYQYVDSDGNVLHQEEVYENKKKQSKNKNGENDVTLFVANERDMSVASAMDARLGISVRKSDDDDSDDDKDKKKSKKSRGKKRRDKEKKRKHDKKRRHRRKKEQEQWAPFCYIPIFSWAQKR